MAAAPFPAAPFPVATDLERVGVLERRIGASLERVWENVLDWEHLPWLHRRDFAWIELGEAGDWGWRARAASRTRPDDPFDLELLVEREAGRYVSRTVRGTGAGTEIWTALAPAGGDATDIRVEFWIPDVPAAARASIGEGYLRLYRRLWDEDEAMMRARTAALDAQRAGPDAAPRRIDLGPRDALLASLPRCVSLGGARWRLVVVDGEPVVHDARCPHRLGPLEDAPEGTAAAGEVQCPWHGYRFDVREGRSSDGRGLRLRRPPRLEHDRATDRVTLALD